MGWSEETRGQRNLYDLADGPKTYECVPITYYSMTKHLKIYWPKTTTILLLSSYLWGLAALSWSIVAQGLSCSCSVQHQHPLKTHSFPHLAAGLGKLKHLRLLGHIFPAVCLLSPAQQVQVAELLSRQLWTLGVCVPSERVRWNLH